MKKVVLIVTGECERLGLAPSLQRYFPSAEFVRPLFLDSFTSARLKPHDRPGARPRQVDRLAAAMIAATDPGRTGERPDLVLAVDDVELTNLDQVDVVVSQLRDAVQSHLAHYDWPSGKRREQVTQRLREHCSFHLLCPMVEAYFFGEPAALTRAGAYRAALMDGQVLDVEDFLTQDPHFPRGAGQDEGMGHGRPPAPPQALSPVPLRPLGPRAEPGSRALPRDRWWSPGPA